MGARSQPSIGFGTILQYISSFSSLFSGLVFYLIMVRLYAPATVGTVTLLLALSSIISLSFSLGLPAGMQHFMSYYLGQEKFNELSSMAHRVIYISMALGLFSALFLVLLSGVISTYIFHSPRDSILIEIIGVNTFLLIMISMLNGILLGLQLFQQSALCSAITSFLSYFIPGCFVILHMGSEAIVIGIIIGNLVGMLIFTVSILRNHFISDIAGYSSFPLSPLFRYSYPIFLSTLIGTGAAYTDRLIVAYFLNLFDVGVYNIALIVTTSLSILVTPIGSVILPKFSQYFSTGDTESIKKWVNVVTSFLSAVYVPVALSLCVLSFPIILIIAGKNYLAGVLPMDLILFSSSLFLAGNVLYAAISSTRNSKIFLVTSSLSIFSNFTLSVLLIPRLHLVGASLAYSSMAAVSFVIMSLFSKKLGVISLNLRALTKIWFSSLVTAGTIFIVWKILGNSIWDIGLSIIIAISTYVLIARAVKVLPYGDVDLVFSLMPKQLAILKTIYMGKTYEQ